MTTEIGGAGSAGKPNPYTLRLHFEGISLWVRRKGYFDVLFPNDREQGGAHHFVTYGPKTGDETKLGDQMVDFVDPLAAKFAPGSDNLDVPGWIGLKLSAGAPAENDKAIFSASDCIGGFRIPYGSISPLPSAFPPVGPFEYKGVEYGFLSHGMMWTGNFGGEPQVTAQLKERKGGQTSALAIGTAATTAPELHYTVRCLSQEDRDDPNAIIEPNEQVSEFSFLGYLAEGKAFPLDETPQYLGGTIHPGPSTVAPDFFVAPRRPCPPAWAL